MKASRIRQRALVLAITGLAVGISACSSGSSVGSSASSSGLGLSNITIGLVPSSDAIAVQIAEDKGFFKQQGLNVKVVDEASTNDTATGLLNHTVDFGQQTYVGLIEQERTIPDLNQRLVVDNTQAAAGNDVLMVSKNSKLTSLSQLAGEKVGIPAPGVNQEAVTLDVLLERYHITSKDYTTVVLPFPDGEEALAKGEVDAAFEIEPFATLAESTAGDRVLADMASGPTNGFPETCWITDAAFAQKYPKTVAAFQRAMASALQVAASDPSYVRSELPKLVTTMKPSLAQVISLPTFNTTASLTRLERVADVMEQLGVLPKNYNVKPMYDPLVSSAS